MKALQIIRELEANREAELAHIHHKYLGQIKPYYHNFTLDEILNAGWVQDSLYAPGSSVEHGYEYLYKKNGKLIRVNHSSIYILAHDQPTTRTIVDLEDLEDYANGLS